MQTVLENQHTGRSVDGAPARTGVALERSDESRGWPTTGIGFGGDWHPEQWPEDTWAGDVALLREAGVNIVTVGVSAWARIQPDRQTWDFDWLHRVLDLVHSAGIGVVLGTSTASAPPWLTYDHPDIRPVDERGTTYQIGSRQTWSASSSVFREHSVDLARRMAEQFSDHPALRMWHINNEFGCHNARCYSAETAQHFRAWLRARYGTIDGLNDAWGTTFWSQSYGAWEQIQVPSLTTTLVNPTQWLDWRRFGSDALLEQYVAERDAVRSIDPITPITTNFMLGMGLTPGHLDYHRWAPEQDVISNDHYIIGFGSPEARLHEQVSWSADLTRGVASGRPWFLMEHSVSGVNWQKVNRAKEPGEMARNTLGHIARGADAACFFQMRQSRAGAEKFHPSVIPHAGADSRRFREFADLGRAVGRIAEVVGSTVEADVAILLDWNSAWGAEYEAVPSDEVRPFQISIAAHRAFLRQGITCDVVPPTADLSRYRIVIVPALYLCSDDAAAAIAAAAENGAEVLVTFFSGIVDENDHARLGGYPGAFRSLLGVRTEEFFPLEPGTTMAVDDGGLVTTWTEDVTAIDTEVLSRLAAGPLAGTPVLTRREVGNGAAWYLSALPDAAGWIAIASRLAESAGVAPVVELPEGDSPLRRGDLELVRRSSDSGSWLFAINHGSTAVRLGREGFDLIGETTVAGDFALAGGAVAVLREPPAGEQQRTEHP